MTPDLRTARAAALIWDRDSLPVHLRLPVWSKIQASASSPHLWYRFTSLLRPFGFHFFFLSYITKPSSFEFIFRIMIPLGKSGEGGGPTWIYGTRPSLAHGRDTNLHSISYISKPEIPSSRYEPWWRGSSELGWYGHMIFIQNTSRLASETCPNM